MTENKLYAQCREEAISILLLKYGNATYLDAERQQLTAEIYGMKLLDRCQDETDEYIKEYKKNGGNWFKSKNLELIGTTQDLHDHFVSEFNKE